MKKCPNCDKKFEDSMRFCQADGTPLVDDAPPLDPYKTIVARPIDTGVNESAATPASSLPGDAPIAEPDDLLDLPEADPLKTMYVSEGEMRRAMGGGGSGELQMDIPLQPETPGFIQSEFSPAPKDAPASPFGSREHLGHEPANSTPAIPSPFSAPPMFTEPPPATPPEPLRPMFTEPPPAVLPYKEPSAAPPSYDEPATVIQDFPPSSPFSSPSPSVGAAPESRFESTPASEPAFKEPEPYRPAVMDAPSPFQQDSPVAWTPPPAPEASWQNQEIGQNTPFQPPAAAGGVNQTLPIISLVLGIASLCCYVSPITGIAALVTGYLGLKNIKADPNNYGGKGLAIGGMVTGGLFLLLGVVYWILMIVGIGLGSFSR
jgi:Domain of unknown function (DUF4190)